jgi:hypothetical protein
MPARYTDDLTLGVDDVLRVVSSSFMQDGPHVVRPAEVDPELQAGDPV